MERGPTSTRSPLQRDLRSLAPSRSPWPELRSGRPAAPLRGPAKVGWAPVWGRAAQRLCWGLTRPPSQPPASPRSPGSPTCVLAATRGSISVSDSGHPVLCGGGRPPPGGAVAGHHPRSLFPAEKVTSLGKDWHRPCLRCERCGKTLTPGGHAEVRPGRGRPAGRGRAARGGARCPLAARPGPAWARRLGGRRCRRCRPPQLPPRWAAGLAETLAAGGSGGRAPGPGGSRRGSEAHGPRPHRPCPVPSTTASPTATSPATEYSSDPRVSVARRVGMCPSPSPLPTTLASLSAGVNTGAVGSYIYDKDPEGKVQP